MIESKEDFYSELARSFKHNPTFKQSKLLGMLSEFVYSNDNNDVFLLKGYAGTGKTTVISTLVNSLLKTNKKSVLLAPTGRAAKVLSGYSKKKAFTIHKKIYFPKNKSGGGVSFQMKANKHSNTFFIVDEASMISDQSQSVKLFQNSSLLCDLITYVESGKNCKLILVGDTAQLPPVKQPISPALDRDTLSFRYGKSVIEIELDEVVRQKEESGILANATELRILLNNQVFDFQFSTSYPDVIKLEDGYEIQDAIITAYNNKESIEDTAIIVRSNKRANQYNEQIRYRVLDGENSISAGDYLMVVKNNYFWVKESSVAGFIANGDICQVERIATIKELYGFKFAEVTIRMIDYPSMKPFETVLLLDTLTSDSPALSYDESNKLYEAVKEDYADEKSKYKQFLAIKKNKYFNALQVKFAYAITCHKSQGGQWNTVFIEKPYLPEGQNIEYLRWLYTAVTRAKEKLYLIGF